MRKQRLVVREALSGVVTYQKRGKRERKSTWRLETSIWAPRLKYCDSRAFFDTPACTHDQLLLDWRRALNRGVGKVIARADDGGEGDAADEVEETLEVLLEYRDLLRSLFDFYASVGSSDVFVQMKLNGYTQFVGDFDLCDPSNMHTKKSAWDQLFVAIDAAPRASDEPELAEPFNNKKMLSFSDFLQVVVRGAVNRYVLSKAEADVSDAVLRLLEHDVLPRVREAPLCHYLVPPNAFRPLIYVEAVDSVLRSHEASLRLIYEQLCALKPVTMEHGGLANKLVGYPDYMRFLRLVNLVNADISERDGELCFVWCRMRTINEQRPKDRIKMMHIHFVDFLEALCRLSQIKALPTDEELKGAGCAGRRATRTRAHSTPARRPERPPMLRTRPRRARDRTRDRPLAATRAPGAPTRAPTFSSWRRRTSRRTRSSWSRAAASGACSRRSSPSSAPSTCSASC